MEYIGLAVFTVIVVAVFLGPVWFSQSHIKSQKSDKPKAGHCW